jgi:hypothetical protein
MINPADRGVTTTESFREKSEDQGDRKIIEFHFQQTSLTKMQERRV